MSKHHQLSLRQAIFINLNVMLGAGIFINTVVLADHAGALAGFSYILVGTLMLPLILSIAQLLELHPAGGFYTFGAEEIHPFAGFMSSWTYFTGKLASATLMIHASILFIQQLIPTLAGINPLLLDLTVLSSFVLLNMLNIKTGSTIQNLFLGFKMIPILFLTLTGLFLFNGAHFTAPHRIWAGIPATVPLVLYATIGFEAACSLSSKIKDAHKNAPRAVLISYGLVIFIACSYQLLFYGAIGDALRNLADYRFAFPALLQKLFAPAPALTNTLKALLHLAIASSALGGSYSIIFSNNWNLYTLAQNKHTFFARHFIKLNKHHIPWLCVLLEGLICSLYFFVTAGNQIPLQQIGALGCVIAYSISAASLVMAKKNKPELQISWWIPLLGTANCLLLITSCIYNLLYTGASLLITFSILLSIGAFMFWWMATQKREAVS